MTRKKHNPGTSVQGAKEWSWLYSPLDGQRAVQLLSTSPEDLRGNWRLLQLSRNKYRQRTGTDVRLAADREPVKPSGNSVDQGNWVHGGTAESLGEPESLSLKTKKKKKKKTNISNYTDGLLASRPEWRLLASSPDASISGTELKGQHDCFKICFPFILTNPVIFLFIPQTWLIGVTKHYQYFHYSVSYEKKLYFLHASSWDCCH